MIQPRSLQQRYSIFLIMPVVLLMFFIGFAGFFYARNLILSQWQEAAVLKLQRAAHQVDMHLASVKELIGIFHLAPEGQDGSRLQFWAIEQLKRQTGVDHVNLTWTNNQASHDDLSNDQMHFGSRSSRGRHPRRVGQSMGMRRR
jgi:hypothetical protein